MKNFFGKLGGKKKQNAMNSEVPPNSLNNVEVSGSTGPESKFRSFASTANTDELSNDANRKKGQDTSNIIGGGF